VTALGGRRPSALDPAGRHDPRDGERGQPYGPGHDQEDGKTFAERGEGDRLSDLRGFTRDAMSQIEADLGTELDWVAVDHRNTADLPLSFSATRS